MNLKIKMLLTSLVLVSVFIVSSASIALATPAGQINGPNTATTTPTPVDPNSCEGGSATACLKSGSVSKVTDVISAALSLLSGGVFLAATIMIVIGGIQYTASNGDPKGVAEAKSKITNVLIGLLAYAFLFAFLEWLIPGGIWVP